MGPTSIVGTAERLDPRDIRNDTTFRIDAGVPALEERVELGWFVPAGLQPDWFRRLAGDAVLVPTDVPGDRDHEFRIDTFQLEDAGAGLAEALGDAADRPAIVAGVEEIRCLDHRQLRLAETAEDRLRGARLPRLGGDGGEELRQPAPALAPLGRHRGCRRRPFLHPAVLDGDLLAERADVDELAALRRIPNRPLPRQQAAVADRARARDSLAADLH